MSAQRPASVWDIFMQTTETPANMQLRAELILALKTFISDNHMNQSQAARFFGITTTRISDLVNDKVEAFGLDVLVKLATKANLKIDMKIRARRTASTER
ncbi:MULTISPECIES: helix-turn-helix domain-containing protein [unclassified Paludibacterium]|uniref:helix-turn-helix domain-containing protein n=1 Tax=unclassified Paludibacterium TaxID=2618429 RepID=UPI001C04B505|nr:XRE family transcriptional regulator [Paludibacterium sp. B53371]BEV70702.1 hypothetical protein THUN1379_01840 [Paludibacterium sp. THUN1379]